MDETKRMTDELRDARRLLSMVVEEFASASNSQTYLLDEIGRFLGEGASAEGALWARDRTDLERARKSEADLLAALGVVESEVGYDGCYCGLGARQTDAYHLPACLKVREALARARRSTSEGGTGT